MLFAECNCRTLRRRKSISVKKETVSLSQILQDLPTKSVIQKRSSFYGKHLYAETEIFLHSFHGVLAKGFRHNYIKGFVIITSQYSYKRFKLLGLQ